MKYYYSAFLKLIFLMIYFSGCQSSVSNNLSSSPATETENSAPTPPAIATSQMKTIAIYYGWPSSLNSATNQWNNTLVADDLAQYNYVVLGAGLEAPSHGDHTNTSTIIQNINQRTPQVTQIYGYIDIGISRSRSLADLQLSIDQWAAIGVKGIFIDEAGFDFKLAGYTDLDMRARQNALLAHIHGLNLKAIFNAWEPDDLFSKEPSAPLSFIAGDGFLLESYFQSFAPYTRMSFVQYRQKIAKLATARSQGLNVFAINTRADTNLNQEHWSTMVAAAYIDGLTAVGWGFEEFSSMSSQMPAFTIPTLLRSIQISSTSINNDLQQMSLRTNSNQFLIDYGSHAYGDDISILIE